MVGSPGQTVEHLIQDILFIEKLRPEMIGIGPFLPHQDTPFARYSSGTLEQTLLLLSIFRLMHPSALIPSTTALATLTPDGRERGDIGRSKCSHAQSVATGGTEKSIPYIITKPPSELNRQKESGYCNNNYITSATRFLSPEEIFKTVDS